MSNLLDKRYLVLSPWPPFNNFQAGDIITPEHFTGWHPSEYPALFRELQWYEFREESEMPEYVKCKNDCCCIATHFVKDAIYKTSDLPNKDCIRFFIPATLEEYEQYIKSLK